MARAIEGLYAVTPETADTELLARMVEAAARGGAVLVQYRNKSGTDAARMEQLRRLAPVCRRHGARLIVNDSVELAREARADGVHLGRDDGDIATARRLLGPQAMIGVSCYDELPRAREAAAAGADYVAFGSFFPSSTKPGAVRASLDLLRQARRELDVPIVAIGGIDASNAALLIDAGADALAVVSALFDAADIEAGARRIARLFPATRKAAAQR
jgi:thiamine-phosphate pyrophosphorylase